MPSGLGLRVALLAAALVAVAVVAAVWSSRRREAATTSDDSSSGGMFEPAEGPPAEPERPPLVAAPPLVDAKPPPVATPRPARETARREWNLWELEQASRKASGDDPLRDEERNYLLVYLREFANAEGTLPADFDSLVRDSFADVIPAR